MIRQKKVQRSGMTRRRRVNGLQDKVVGHILALRHIKAGLVQRQKPFETESKALALVILDGT
jgi:hypothetical protein